MLSRSLTATVVAFALQMVGVSGLASQPKPALDFDYFAKRVEPIFLRANGGEAESANDGHHGGALLSLRSPAQGRRTCDATARSECARSLGGARI